MSSVIGHNGGPEDLALPVIADGSWSKVMSYVHLRSFLDAQARSILLTLMCSWETLRCKYGMYAREARDDGVNGNGLGRVARVHSVCQGTNIAAAPEDILNDWDGDVVVQGTGAGYGYRSVLLFA